MECGHDVCTLALVVTMEQKWHSSSKERLLQAKGRKSLHQSPQCMLGTVAELFSELGLAGYFLRHPRIASVFKLFVWVANGSWKDFCEQPSFPCTE